MKVPSDAQAALLGLIADHEAHGRNVEWAVNGEGHGKSKAVLYVELVDREKNTARLDSADGYRWRHRTATVRSCIRHGWLNDLHRRTLDVPTGYLRGPAKRTLELVQLDTLEDGMIALGLWRERKLNAPPAPLPTLDGVDREVMEIAAAARHLGYKLAPASDEARAQARRLARAGWARRGFIGGSVSSVEPTPMSIVETDPEAADVAG